MKNFSDLQNVQEVELETINGGGTLGVIGGGLIVAGAILTGGGALAVGAGVAAGIGTIVSAM